jgi:hypothetical protein
LTTRPWSSFFSMTSRISRPMDCERLARIAIIKRFISVTTWFTKPNASLRRRVTHSNLPPKEKAGQDANTAALPPFEID